LPANLRGLRGNNTNNAAEECVRSGSCEYVHERRHTLPNASYFSWQVVVIDSCILSSQTTAWLTPNQVLASSTRGVTVQTGCGSISTPVRATRHALSAWLARTGLKVSCNSVEGMRGYLGWPHEVMPDTSRVNAGQCQPGLLWQFPREEPRAGPRRSASLHAGWPQPDQAHRRATPPQPSPSAPRLFRPPRTSV